MLFSLHKGPRSGPLETHGSASHMLMQLERLSMRAHQERRASRSACSVPPREPISRRPLTASQRMAASEAALHKPTGPSSLYWHRHEPPSHRVEYLAELLHAAPVQNRTSTRPRPQSARPPPRAGASMANSRSKARPASAATRAPMSPQGTEHVMFSTRGNTALPRDRPHAAGASLQIWGRRVNVAPRPGSAPTRKTASASRRDTQTLHLAVRGPGFHESAPDGTESSHAGGSAPAGAPASAPAADSKATQHAPPQQESRVPGMRPFLAWTPYTTACPACLTSVSFRLTASDASPPTILCFECGSVFDAAKARRQAEVIAAIRLQAVARGRGVRQKYAWKQIC